MKKASKPHEPLGKTHLKPQPNPQTKVYGSHGVVNVFFDGTLNNYYNIIKGTGFNNDTSYANDFSNVARMWASIKDDLRTNCSLYIDGIGTTRLKDDSLKGYAFGDEGTGVMERADSAFGQLYQKITDTYGALPDFIHINVFGFSRGAAAARTFIHWMKTEKEKRLDNGKNKEWKGKTVFVNFVGLFDTVSSYAPTQDRHGAGGLVPNDNAFDNDVPQLHLNFNKGYAKRVLHITAGDEFRANFSLTNIQSAIALGIGYELEIPGAHSDVGGGYHPTEKESHRIVDAAFKAHIVQKGWYHQNDLPSNRGYQWVHRTVFGQYHKIALAVMVDAANHYGAKIKTDILKVFTNKPDGKDVLEIQTKLREFAKKDSNTRWSIDAYKQHENPTYAPWFRRNFLHLSAEAGSISNGYAKGFKRKHFQG